MINEHTCSSYVLKQQSVGYQFFHMLNVNLQHEILTIRCLYYQMITFLYLLQVGQPLHSERDDTSSSPLLPISQEGDLVRIFLL